VGTVRALEAFLAAIAESIVEIAVQGEDGILHQRINTKVEALYWFASHCNVSERLFDLARSFTSIIKWKSPNPGGPRPSFRRVRR
jgi:hypothetical protein